jgi:Skp family chaperone for outer membrane proteins
MTSRKTPLGRNGKLTLGLLAIATVLVGFACVGVTTASRAILARPTTVVSVNLPAVLEKLDERVRAELRLKSMAEEMQSEDTEWQEKIKASQAALTDVPEADLAQRQKLGEALALQVLEFEAWRRFATESIDIEKSLLLRDLDNSVKRAISELAAANGYDIVVMDDTGQELAVNPDSQVPRELQVKQQMVARRLLYVNPSVDITDQLIERMNNAFNAP